MFCNKCGKQNKANDAFCGGCGEKLQQPTISAPTFVKRKPPKKKSSAGLLVGFCLLITAALAVGIFFALQADSEDNGSGLFAIDGGINRFFADNMQQDVQDDSHGDANLNTNVAPDVVTGSEPMLGTDQTGESEPYDANVLVSALMAFRTFMETPQSVEDEWQGTLLWTFEDIRRVELVDFDNDGVPELVLIIDFSSNFPDIANEWIYYSYPYAFLSLIIRYTRYVEVIFHATTWFSHTGDSWSEFFLAYGVSDEIFLMHSFGSVYFGYHDGIPLDSTQGFTYSALNNGNWESLLELESFYGSGFLQGFVHGLVNGEPVSEIEYINAPFEALGVTETRWISEISNDINTLLKYIDTATRVN